MAVLLSSLIADRESREIQDGCKVCANESGYRSCDLSFGLFIHMPMSLYLPSAQFYGTSASTHVGEEGTLPYLGPLGGNVAMTCRQKKENKNKIK